MNKKGFTLIEVMLTLLLISVVLLAILTNLQILLRSASNNRDHAQALQIATSLLEKETYDTAAVISNPPGFTIVRQAETSDADAGQSKKLTTITVSWPLGSCSLQRTYWQGIP